MARKKMIHEFYEMKARGEKIAFLTSYDYPTAQFAQAAGLDMLLVGDSLGMCVYGYPSTIPVTMEQCIGHAEAVRRGAPDTFVVGDMPFMSYQSSCEVAVANAGRFLKEAEVDAVKLEGGVRVAGQIGAIADAGIVVMGHIGLTPQSTGQLGGHKAQGRTLESARMVVRDALAVQEAGAHMILLEAIPPEVGGYITRTLSIPVLSIGAGSECDGQLLIVADLIGQFQAFTPKFVKKYCDVAGTFPAEEHCYRMLEGEEERFRAEFD
jgi:3-methyl-2-oxobutanoate hydroxymethyltransferase